MNIEFIFLGENLIESHHQVPRRRYSSLSRPNWDFSSARGRIRMEFLPWRACWRQMAWLACESNCVSPQSSAAPCCWWSLLTWRALYRRTIVALETKRDIPFQLSTSVADENLWLRSITHFSRDENKGNLWYVVINPSAFCLFAENIWITK